MLHVEESHIIQRYDLNYSILGNTCVADNRTYTCSLKSANSVWNTISTYSQTWNGSTWLPAYTTTSNNDISSSNECRYKCDIGFTWDGSACIVETCTFDTSTYGNCNFGT